mmetsp:Transcript_16383/g.37921  ORF Transcript_16383/g.37921 Transcript_16383/m.37921 type:complete len:418 (-) Transcript_16383:277-1530(-)
MGSVEAPRTKQKMSRDDVDRDPIIANDGVCRRQGDQSTNNESPFSSREKKRRRRSSRGNSCITELAKEVVTNRKRVVFITGAGLSVASGIRPFRGKSNHRSEALWTQHIWTNATRESFRKDPLGWYNDFWLPCLSLPHSVRPNAGHRAVQWLLNQSISGGGEALRIRMITQNVDGLMPPNPLHTIEAHGRLGLFKCIPDEDSDTDSESDDDDNRLVHLGHRRKWREHRDVHNKQVKSRLYRNRRRRRRSGGKGLQQPCPYQTEKSLSINEIEPAIIRENLRRGKGPLPEAPKCPHCGNTLAPQALLFDEGYHSHDFYEFQKMEEWLAEAEVIVFIGTSFAVRLPEVTLEHARALKIPVYNFNTHDMLSPTPILDAYNIRGRAEETLPLLAQEVADLQKNSKSRRTSTRLRQRGICAK